MELFKIDSWVILAINNKKGKTFMLCMPHVEPIANILCVSMYNHHYTGFSGCVSEKTIKETEVHRFSNFPKAEKIIEFGKFNS